MKKIIKISSLGLVALLASCGKNAATPLKIISPTDAISVANAIYYQQAIDKVNLKKKDLDVSTNNGFYKNDLFPYTHSKLSADVIIKQYQDAEMPSMGLTSKSTTDIKKHIFVDLDNLYFHAHISYGYSNNGSTSYKYPDIDYYGFFIERGEDEQYSGRGSAKEPLVGYARIGDYFMLEKIGNIAKLMIDSNTLDDGKAISKTNFVTGLLGMFSLFSDDINSLVTYDTDEHTFELNLDSALSFNTSSVLMNLGYTDVCCKNTTGNSLFESDYIEDNTLLMTNFLNTDNDSSAGIAYTVSQCFAFQNALKTQNNENIYFDFAFKSNDAQSLGFETNFGNTDTRTSSGATTSYINTQSSSFTIRDAYLAESHLTSIQTAEEKTEDGTVVGKGNSSITFDQTINYNPGDKVDIPSDYLDYIPGM